MIPIPCLPDTLFDALVQLVVEGVSRGESDVLDSWLFVRNEESVHIVRRGEFELSVRGPRWRRAVHRFDSELELSSHQAEYEQRLVNEGFTFEGFRRDRRRGQPSMVRSRSTVARMLSAIPIRIPRRSPAPGRGRTSTLALIHS